jgi:thiol-disulfide isomerase/thioredoxin
LAVAATAVVVAVIVALVAVKIASGSGTAKQATVITPADPAVLSQINSVPVSTLVHAAKSTSPPNPLQTIKGAAVTVGGKPLVLYIGAEYCPYCAATRWALVMALSKFGTL